MAVSTSTHQIPAILSVYLSQFFTFLHWVTQLPQASIATLGPTATSSEAAAHHLLQSFGVREGQVNLQPTYEDALGEVVSDRSDMLLVANAYERIDAIYMANEVRLGLAFAFDTPPYGVAKRPGNRLPSERRLTIATHHAPIGLLPLLLQGQSFDYELVLARSTSEAALQAREGNADLCITNVNAAILYNVEFITELHPIHMLWSVFTKATSK